MVLFLRHSLRYSNSSHQLGLPEDPLPVLKPACITGGMLMIWDGKYTALVDGTSRVEGSAYLLVSSEHEDALRSYETDKYEVVRCAISIAGKEASGCTFRFVGDLDGGTSQL